MNLQPYSPNKLLTNSTTQLIPNQTYPINTSTSFNTTNTIFPSHSSSQLSFPSQTSHLSNQLPLSNTINHTSSSLSSSQHTSQPQIPHPLNQLHIASLNTRGLNDDTKFKCLLKFIEIKNYSIFGISETKIKESSKKYLSNNNYKIHWSSTNYSQAGVALIINPHLFRHHLKTESYNGYIISSFFNFKPSTTLCISQIYLPHDPTTKKQVINYLKKLITQNSSKNIPHIIMGDFNSVPNPSTDRLHNNTPSQKNPIYNYLTNYTDTFRHLHPYASKFTFTGPTQQSRIDQIWLSNIITNYLTQANITKTNSEFRSDHKITSITLNSFFKTDNYTPFPSTYTKYNHFQLNLDDWSKIKKSLDENIQPLLSNSDNPQNLWNSIQDLFNNHVLSKIPKKKIKTKSKNLFNKNGTLLHNQLLLINSTLYKIKKNNNNKPNNTSLIPTSLTKELKKLNLPYQSSHEAIQSLKNLYKKTLLQLKIENKILTQEKIKESKKH